MFRPVVRAASRTVSHGTITSPGRRIPTRRWASTAADKPRSWKSGAVRWGLAGAVVYYYNTTNVFAEEANDQYAHYPPPVSSDTDEYRTLESYSKKPAPVPALSNTQTASVPVTAGGESATPIATGGASGLEAEASQQGAFNEETGEINWDCPCLGGMAHGPCGEEFKAAFSCFVYSHEEPKGVDCIDKFKGMQDCFRAHPDIYGSELEDDDEDGQLQEGEAGAAPALARDGGALETAPSVDDAAAPVIDDVQAKVSTAKDEIKEKATNITADIKENVAIAKEKIQEGAESVKDKITSKTSGAKGSKTVKEADATSEVESVVPKAAHDATDAKA